MLIVYDYTNFGNLLWSGAGIKIIWREEKKMGWRRMMTIGGDPGGGGDVSPPPPLLPRIFLGGSSPPPLDFWKLEKYIFIYLHNGSNTKRLIQHTNTTKHTKSLNLPRASRTDSPSHISASLASPAISVARGGFGFCRYIWKFVGTCKPTSMSFCTDKVSEVPTKNIERNSSFRM